METMLSCACVVYLRLPCHVLRTMDIFTTVLHTMMWAACTPTPSCTVMRCAVVHQTS